MLCNNKLSYEQQFFWKGNSHHVWCDLEDIFSTKLHKALGFVEALLSTLFWDDWVIPNIPNISGSSQTITHYYSYYLLLLTMSNRLGV